MAGRLILKSMILLVWSCLFAWSTVSEAIDPIPSKYFFPGNVDGENSKTENIVVSFSESMDTVFNHIKGRNFLNDGEKRIALTRNQKIFAERSQAPLQSFLRSQGVPFESFWISNVVTVKNASPSLVNAISKFPGVLKVEKEPVSSLNIPYIGEPVEGLDNVKSSRQSQQAWGIERIRANQLWSSFTGRGVVVAIIDTGVRHTHEVLRNRWRNNGYGWYDPYENTSTPVDEDGHGTHVAGTLLGSNNIGVAPHSTWIACRGCRGNSCGTSELLACGQWVQCPTYPNGENENCNQAPKIVSNSWGWWESTSWYDNVIRSWQNAGIIPVFSIGNYGPYSFCSTTGSPGDRQGVISVGSTERDEKISEFSSFGPARDRMGHIKPDISAPGGHILSAWHTSDRAYNTMSGTSMACPHVSGVISLMLQKRPHLTFREIYRAITRTAVTDLDPSWPARECGRRNATTFPNNIFGWGRIDAINALNAV